MDSVPTRAAPPAPPVPRRRLLLAVMCTGMFLVQLDVTVVNVALPAIRDGLGAGLAGQQWVVDGYSVVLASLLLTGGALGDRFGHGLLVVSGMALFGVASLACGLAPGAGVLVAARAVQGVGAAMLLPCTLAVITHAFPGRAEQARAIGVWSGISALALPAGPPLGGALVSALGWRSVFLVNVPITVLAVPAVLGLARGVRGEHVRRLDVPGSALVAVALAATVYAVIEGGSRGSELAWAALAAAVLSGVAFLGRERAAAEPLLPPALLRNRPFVSANLVAAAMNGVGVGTIFIATLYLQTVQHRSALLGGALLVPLFAPLAALAPVTGRITARWGPRPPVLAGLVVGGLGSAALCGLEPGSGYARFLPVLLGVGAGMGLITAAVISAAVGAVPAERAGLASGANNTARLAAGSLGVAIYGAVTGTPSDPVGFTGGLHLVGAGAAALWAACLVVAWFALRRTA